MKDFSEDSELEVGGGGGYALVFQSMFWSNSCRVQHI